MNYLLDSLSYLVSAVSVSRILYIKDEPEDEKLVRKFTKFIINYSNDPFSKLN
jgi:hypothetical protein